MSPSTVNPSGVLLAIEASNPSMYAGDEGSVAVVREGAVTLQPMRTGARHDDSMMRSIDDACRAAGVAPTEISRVAVGIGPGGYTGLRIAVTTAKMLAETLGAEVVGVPTAAAIATGFVADHPADAASGFVVLLASKRDTVWAQVFRGTREISPGAIVNASTLGAILRASGVTIALADAQLPDGLRSAVSHARAETRAPRLDAHLCAIASGSFPSVAVDALGPIYPREPEAVTKWRERATGDRR